MRTARLIVVAMACLVLSGCSWFADKRIVVKPKPVPVDTRNRWMALAYYVEKHYDTTDWTTEEIAAELSLAYHNFLTEKADDTDETTRP